MGGNFHLDINLKFKSNGKSIEVGKGKPYRLLSIEGLEASDYEIFSTDNVMGDGANVNNKKIKARNLMPEIKYVGDNENIERQRIISFFNLHKKGELTVTINEIARVIEYEVNSLKFNQQNINNPLKFLVNLYCPDPFFKDVTETRTDVSTEIGGFEFPLEIPTEGLELSIRTINYITNIYNGGSVETPIRVVLRAIGTVENPIIENLDTGEYIRVKRTLSKGDVLEINTEFGNKRVEIIRDDGSRENVFNYIDYKSKFFSIDSGDTRLKYGADLGDSNLDVYIYYTPRYLGV